MIRLTSEELKYIMLFERLTGATVKDCILGEEGITFVVKEGDMGLAIGRKGAVIARVRKELGCEIHVYEHSGDPQRFIANLLFPIGVERVELDGESARVYIRPAERKRAIGRGGKKIKAVRDLADRHFGIKEIKVM